MSFLPAYKSWSQIYTPSDFRMCTQSSRTSLHLLHLPLFLLNKTWHGQTFVRLIWVIFCGGNGDSLSFLSVTWQYESQTKTKCTSPHILVTVPKKLDGLQLLCGRDLNWLWLEIVRHTAANDAAKRKTWSIILIWLEKQQYSEPSVFFYIKWIKKWC